MNTKCVVRCGIGLMVQNTVGEVLLGFRHTDPAKADSELQGEGTWTFPGGKMEFGESIFASAERELKEETGLRLKEMKLISISNIVKGDAHFVTLGFLVSRYSGVVKVMEKDEIIKWQWFPSSALPKNIYLPSRRIIQALERNTIIDFHEV